MSGILLGSGDPAVDKKDTALTSQSLTSSAEDTKHNNYANDYLSGDGVNSSQVLPCLQGERQVWAAPQHSVTPPPPADNLKPGHSCDHWPRVGWTRWGLVLGVGNSPCPPSLTLSLERH